MNAQTFCLYTLAAACLLWGVLGLRFGLSVLGANAVLAFLLLGFDVTEGGSNLQIALMLSYPLYWGLAYALFGLVERLGFPAFSLPLRFGMGMFAALGIMLYAHWVPVERAGALVYLTYLVDPAERAPRLAGFLHRSSRRQLCGESYATLMGLAEHAGDKEVTRVLFESFALCDGAAATLEEVLRPVIDTADTARLRFFLENGLSPDTEVFGFDYANGTALAYAATIARQPEMVRMIVASAPEKALGMRYLRNMLERLKEEKDTRMLSVLHELGIKNPYSQSE